MKTAKILGSVMALLVLGSAAFSQESEVPEKKENKLSLYTEFDFAYYPKSEFRAGGDHFSCIDGIYSGLEARFTGKADYRIATPLGQHWLLNDAGVVLRGMMEVSPVTIMPGAEVIWEPLPFLNFSTGAQASTGWEFLAKGMAEYSTKGPKPEYENATPFQDWYLKWWAQAILKFDLGAVVKNDWAHVVFLYTYQTYYARLTCASDGDVWMWRGSGNMANGWSNWQCLVLGYQMPLKLSLAGVMTEFEGHYSSSDYPATYDGNFMEISIAPFVQIDFTKKDMLNIFATFGSRRSFQENHPDDDQVWEPLLTASGREWYFKRIAFRYTHIFK